MNKKCCYLPSLNALYLQQVNYQQHLQKLNRSKSSYDYKKVSLEVDEPSLDSKSRNHTQQPVVRGSDSLQIRKREKGRLSPLERRKMTQRDHENSRLVMVLQSSNPSVYGYDPRRSEAIDVLKQRISKFQKQGSAVQYKFKKSLAEIERRKVQKSLIKAEDHSFAIEDIRQQLASLKQKRSKTHQSRAQSHLVPCHDLFTQDFSFKSKQSLKMEGQMFSSGQQQSSKQTMPMSKTNSRSSVLVGGGSDFLTKRIALQQLMLSKMKSQSRKGGQLGGSKTILMRIRKSKQPIDMQVVAFPTIRNKNQ